MATAPKETPKNNNSLRDFQGINTQAARQVIGDNQFAWIENVMPIGFGNMPAVPGPSASLASWIGGPAYHMRSIVIGNITYEVIFLTNGAIYAYRLDTYAGITVGAAGTLSGDDSEIAQWSNDHAIIVDPTKGYFIWDGSTLTNLVGQLASISITTIGSGYTTVPTIGGFSSGGGSGGSATCHIQVGLFKVTSAGTGYNVGDVVTVAGGTYTTPASAQVTSITTGGVINGVNLLSSGDYTIAPSNPASTTSPYGTGATVTLNFGIGPITLTAPGSGYTSQPTLTVTGGSGTGGSVTANLSVVPSGGSSVAVYAGRVWVASNRTVAFSAPNSFSDFSIANAGGSFIVSDETLVGSITALRAANNFLYLIGASSVNVVADVSVVNGSTVFSNTNISASVGTQFENSIYPYYRGMWFANNYGVYALYGSTTQKMSDDLDGIFPLLTNSESTLEITSGTVVLFDILCFALLAQYNDPINGSRAILMIFFNKKWYIASQGNSLVNIDSPIINGVPTLYGTDGTHLYQLFASTTTPVTQKIVSKLWDMGDPLTNKAILKFGIEVFNPAVLQSFSGTVDTESGSGSVPFSFTNSNTVKWINSQGQVVQWENTSLAIVDWIYIGYSFLPIDMQTSGRYLGFTLNSSSIQTLYEGFHMQYEMRTSWPQGGPQ